MPRRVLARKLLEMSVNQNKSKQMMAAATIANKFTAAQGVEQTGQDEAPRANAYGLLGALLAAPPKEHLVTLLRQIDPVDEGRDQAMGQAWEVLRLAAAGAAVDGLDDEYHALFIGLGRGELVPYASWYLTGFMMDQPLAVLRSDLDALGFERQPDVHEPEDHVAALCETMSVIIGIPGEIPFETQKRFFDEHIQPWMSTFFLDLQKAKTARFYRAVGQFGYRFMEFEKEYMSMPA